MATAAVDPHLGSGPDEDDVSLSGSESDSDSILSDDSVLPDYMPARKDGNAATTLYEACNRNDPVTLLKVLERGVTQEEVMELDINGWVRVSLIMLKTLCIFLPLSLILTFDYCQQNGLMVACCKGFIDIVYGLHNCPFIDINHQDNEGNTALMIASQAGESFLHKKKAKQKSSSDDKLAQKYKTNN